MDTLQPSQASQSLKAGTIPATESASWEGPARGLALLKGASMPRFLELLPLFGPALVWACVAIGSGEVQSWPYFAAKYGSALIGLALPLVLIQFWVNQEIARYTLLTGEGIWVGLGRIGRWYIFLLTAALIISWLGFGSFLASGSEGLARLTQAPAGLSLEMQTLFWSGLMMSVFCLLLVFGRRPYEMVEALAFFFLAVALGGMVLVVSQPDIIGQAGSFMRAFLNPVRSLQAVFAPQPGDWPRPWDPKDTLTLANAVAFAGLGGFLNLMFSYWLKERRAGMARLMTPLPGLRGGPTPLQPVTGYQFADTPENRKHYFGWFQAARWANLLAIGVTVLGLLLPIWVAWGREASAPGFGVTATLAKFMGFGWGSVGMTIFFLAVAAYLIDSWVIIADGSARVLTDFMRSQFSWGFRRSERAWYLDFLAMAVVVTIPALVVDADLRASMLQLQGLAHLFGFALFCPGLIYLNYVLLPRQFPKWTRPGGATLVMMVGVTAVYWGVGIWYLWYLISQNLIPFLNLR